MEKGKTHLNLHAENYSHTVSNSWEGRIDGQEFHVLRFHQIIKCVDVLEQSIPIEKGKKSFALIGFSCDEGVKRNQGRTGASRGPDFIRKNLKNLPLHHAENLQLWDFGNIVCTDGNLEKAQESLSNLIQWTLSQKIFPIVLGGGHEVTYGHVKGIQEFLKNENENRLFALNFDAHFDNRECLENKGNSGTGFYQLMLDSKNENTDFTYFTWGVQKSGNTPLLFERAIEDKASVLLAEDFHSENKSEIDKFFKPILDSSDAPTPLYFTIDLDGFRMDSAPGVSAPSALGISPDHLFQHYFKKVLQAERLVSLDIAELNPDHDIDERTAKLAAQLVFLIIHETKPYPSFFNFS